MWMPQLYCYYILFYLVVASTPSHSQLITMSTLTIPLIGAGITVGAALVAGTIGIGAKVITRQFKKASSYGYQPQYDPYGEPYYNGYQQGTNRGSYYY